MPSLPPKNIGAKCNIVRTWSRLKNKIKYHCNISQNWVSKCTRLHPSAYSFQKISGEAYPRNPLGSSAPPPKQYSTPTLIPPATQATRGRKNWTNEETFTFPALNILLAGSLQFFPPTRASEPQLAGYLFLLNKLLLASFYLDLLLNCFILTRKLSPVWIKRVRKGAWNFKKSIPLVLTLSTRIWEQKQFNLADTKINWLNGCW